MIKNLSIIATSIAMLTSPAFAEANYVQKTNIDSGDGNMWVDGVRISIAGSTQFVVLGEMGLNRSNLFNSKRRVAWAEDTFGVGFDDRYENNGFTTVSYTSPGPDGVLGNLDDAAVTDTTR